MPFKGLPCHSRGLPKQYKDKGYREEGGHQIRNPFAGMIQKVIDEGRPDVEFLLQGIGGDQKYDVHEKIGGRLRYPYGGLSKKISKNDIDKYGQAHEKEDEPADCCADGIDFFDDFKGGFNSCFAHRARMLPKCFDVQRRKNPFFKKRLSLSFICQIKWGACRPLFDYLP